MDLVLWQEKLAAHFETLSSQRHREAPGQPTFGLEHGLTAEEIAGVSEGIHAEIREGAPRWSHRLGWLVYASEFGYQYAGDEYWQTFQEKTPGWEANGDRHFCSALLPGLR